MSAYADVAAQVHREWLEAGRIVIPPDEGEWDELAYWREVDARRAALQEARYTEKLHPRDRLGRWIRKLGLPAYKVGGAVRDPILGKKPKDVDFMVMASPEDILEAVRATGHKAEPLIVRDRLVGVRAHGPELPEGGVELAPPRVEVSTGPGRKDFAIVPHPAVMGEEDDSDPMERDALRRDFTVNALYEDALTGEQVDPTGRGFQDAERRTLSVVGDDSFLEDPLRILRGIRFIGQHGLDPDERTLALMREHADKVDHLTDKGVSGTVMEELNKTLMGEHVGKALRIARDTGVLERWLPEWKPVIGFNQESKYHNLTADEHIIRVVEQVANQDGNLRTRLAALFHDAGKPEGAWRGEDGRLHYYANPELGKEDHAVIGARKAWEALTRMNYPDRLKRDVVLIVSEHMLKEANSKKLSKVRRLRQRVIANGGDDSIIADLVTHRTADRRGKGEDDDALPVPEVERFATLLKRVRNDPVKVTELAIDGRDLIDLGFVPGPLIGSTLRALLERVMAQPELNTREWLLQHAAKLRP